MGEVLGKAICHGEESAEPFLLPPRLCLLLSGGGGHLVSAILHSSEVLGSLLVSHYLVQVLHGVQPERGGGVGVKCGCVQWNLSIKDTLNKGHLSNEDTICSPNHIELCTNLSLNWGHLSIQDSQQVPMVSSIERFTVYRTASWVPMVPSIERFHCIQDSQLGPSGVLYREVPLHTYLCTSSDEAEH